jgi:hypothetical protein
MTYASANTLGLNPACSARLVSWTFLCTSNNQLILLLHYHHSGLSWGRSMSMPDIRLIKAEKHNPLHTYQSERFAPTNIVTGVTILFKANRPDTDNYFDIQRREALRRSK